MDLKKLKFFLVLAEELHYGKAAARLHMTQPPLSQAIRSLEEDLGVELFIRTKRSVVLSPTGKQWLCHVQKLMDDVSKLKLLAQQLERGEHGQLLISFISTAEYSILPQLLRHFKELYPYVEVVLKDATSDFQLEAILNGDIDIGCLFLPREAHTHTALAHRPLIEETIVAAVPEKWIENGRIPLQDDHVILKKIIHEPLVLFARRYGSIFHDLVTSYYIKNGRPPNILQEAIQMQTIISLVSAEMGIALVPHCISSLKRDGVRYLPLYNSPKIVTSIVWRRDNASASLKNFIQILK